ncbi:MAG: GntR family transcriptional regulator [Bacteroidaceae bacterium]|nr:GntR family transcriptional regulator [Bacteroidaceae bacterium]
MDFKEHKAIYLQIAERICDSILNGEFPEDEKLPSVREYAAQVEVNVNTVARSFEWLQMNDVVVTRRGLGNFVNVGAKKAVERIRRKEFFTEQLPDLFRTIHTLGISIDEVVTEYNKSN